MSDKTVTERAEFLSQMAPNPSVTAEVLADDEPAFVESRLSGAPPVTYLEDSEAPAYVLTNTKRGMAAGGKHNQTKPDKGRGAVALVTGRRTLCLVGADPDDKALEIPHTDVAEVSYHTGFLTNRLEIRTTRRVYHCWVSRSTDTEILEDAAAYIEDRAGADPEELEPDAMPESDTDEQFTYRGKVVTNPSGTESESGSEDTTAATATTDGGATDAAPEPAAEPNPNGKAADPDDAAATTETDPTERACRNCGEQLDADVNFCPTCGTAFSENDTDTDTAEGQESDDDGEDSESSGSETVMYRGREVDASYLK
jgi:hypothetical protein